MNRRTLLLLVLGIALAGMIGIGSAQAADVVKVGVVGPKTGPLAGGAAITHWPNFKLWAHQINARGGLKLKSGMRKVEIIEYDDRTQPGEAIKAVERLATQDKADFIAAPYGTGFNLASAPIFAKYGYPQIAVHAITGKRDELTKRYPTIFFIQSPTTVYARDAAKVLKKLRDAGKIGNRVAMVNVGDTFGIELANAARPIFKEAGFNIVYDKSYPLGTPDLAPVIKAAQAAKPDAFVAWSYPPDTFGLTEQAKIEGLKVKAYYSAVGTAFQSFAGKYGSAIENVLGAGGLKNTPEMRAYQKAHKEVTGVDSDYWGSPVGFAAHQVLEQAIEGVGSLDRKAVTAYIKKNSFKTVMGEIKFINQKVESFWTVGQWQNGYFYGVEGNNVSNPKPVRLKTGW